jgi:hypothetical protein
VHGSHRDHCRNDPRTLDLRQLIAPTWMPASTRVPATVRLPTFVRVPRTGDTSTDANERSGR